MNDGQNSTWNMAGTGSIVAAVWLWARAWSTIFYLGLRLVKSAASRVMLMATWLLNLNRCRLCGSQGLYNNGVTTITNGGRDVCFTRIRKFSLMSSWCNTRIYIISRKTQLLGGKTVNYPTINGGAWGKPRAWLTRLSALDALIQTSLPSIAGATFTTGR